MAMVNFIIMQLIANLLLDDAGNNGKSCNSLQMLTHISQCLKHKWGKGWLNAERGGP